jgi:LmbE family N-acetylglucosaminyl deacetylase
LPFWGIAIRERRKHVTTARRALFIFAHQDDEYAAAPWLREELQLGNDVACVYLTDGGSRVAPALRDAESRGVLHSLGVADEAIAFLSSGGARIPDGALATQSLDGLDMLQRWIETSGFVPNRIYSHAYEGGHPDHDAAHLIAARLAMQYNALDDAWQFALYNAYRCPRPFFTTLRQIPSVAPQRKAAMPLRTRIGLSWLCWKYRSQRRTWLGLFPGAFLERVLLGRESVVRFDLARLSQRPHAGELLYERLFGTTYEEFARDVHALTPPPSER